MSRVGEDLRCPYCAQMIGWGLGYMVHTRRCAKSTPEERDFWIERGRWPQNPSKPLPNISS